MSVLLQIALSALVIGGVGFGLWNHNHNQEMKKEDHASVNASVNLSTGSSNADLDRDMLTIDGQLKAVDQGSGEVDQSFNDKSTLEN